MYAVFFDDGNTTYRLPTNPEEIEVSSTQAVQKYEILKLGQIAVPTHMELMQYSFECEFPLKQYSYVEMNDGNQGIKSSGIASVNTEEKENQILLGNWDSNPKFLTSGFYINLFSDWRKKMVPVRFIAGRVFDNERVYNDSINTKVLMEDLTITEKAGEEGDKYISFKLLEYRDFSKKTPDDVNPKTGKTQKITSDGKNPKSKGTYVVQSGDCLWAISKKYYGDGSKYTKIFNANKDKIKNPSLIYPGEKLVIP